MEQSEYEKFVALLTEGAEYFRDNQPLTEARIAIYWKALAGYEFDRILKAFNALYESRKFDGLPKAADILECIRPEWKEPAKPEPLTSAELEGTSAAWRFNRYLVSMGKWKDLGADRDGYSWRKLFEEWKAQGQPAPVGGQQRPMLKVIR